VYIVDVSGSMEQTDSEHFVRDALKLGIDLAPENSRVAIVAVSDRVVFETGLTDVSRPYGRHYLKEHVRRLQNRGNTDFTLGFMRALEILQASDAAHRRIIFLGDFIEGGHNVGRSAEAVQAVNRIGDISFRANTLGVAIDMILWENEPTGSVTARYFLELPQNTGGSLIRLTNPGDSPAHIENVYFQNFEYKHFF